MNTAVHGTRSSNSSYSKILTEEMREGRKSAPALRRTWTHKYIAAIAQRSAHGERTGVEAFSQPISTL